MSNVDRVLTLRIKITDDEKSKGIWQSMMGESTDYGFQISGISDSDLFKIEEKLEAIHQAIDELDHE